MTVRICILNVLKKISVTAEDGISILGKIFSLVRDPYSCSECFFSCLLSVSITDGTGTMNVTITHPAMEQLFDFAFPIKNVLKMKKELKEGCPL